MLNDGVVLTAIRDSGRVEQVDQALIGLEQFKARHARALRLEEEVLSVATAPLVLAPLGISEPADARDEPLRQLTLALETVYHTPVDASPSALRQVPLDLLTAVVLRELGGAPFAPTAVMQGLLTIWSRYDGRGDVQTETDAALALWRRVTPRDADAFDVVDPCATSSFLPHEGASRFRDGG